MSLWRAGPCRAPLLTPPLLLPDKQSSNASLETLLALLQAEGAKIEEDTEVKPAKAPGPPAGGRWRLLGVRAAQEPQGAWSTAEGCTLHCEHTPCSAAGCSESAGGAEPVGRSQPSTRGLSVPGR